MNGVWCTAGSAPLAGVSIEVDSALSFASLRRLEARPAALADPVAAEWPEAYAETRHGGQGPLFGEGDPDDAIQALAGAGEAEVDAIIDAWLMRQTQ